jgi:hypothetical protein
MATMARVATTAHSLHNTPSLGHITSATGSTSTRTCGEDPPQPNTNGNEGPPPPHTHGDDDHTITHQYNPMVPLHHGDDNTM